MTAATTLPQLRRFLEDGGTIVAIGSATGISEQLGLPLGNHLSEHLADGTERGLSREKYYVPGSIVQVTVDTSNPLAYGLPEKLDVFYSNNPVFRFEPDAALKGLKPVAWFATEQPLRSGWAWGQAYLKGGLAAVEAPVGKGKVYLFGPEITFRAQPHGAFKFLFNGMYLAGATPVRLGPAGRSNN